MTRSALLLPFFGLLLTVTGCEPSGPKVYQVKGKLTINGAPAKNVQVNFYPTDNFGTLGSGIVQDGSYELLSGNQGRPGVAAGKYKVVLQQMGASGKEAAMSRYSGGDKSGPPTVATENSFPKEWSSEDTTPKEVEVKAQNNVIDIDVKS